MIQASQPELGEQHERPPPRPPSGTKPPEARPLRSASYNQGDMRTRPSHSNAAAQRRQIPPYIPQYYAQSERSIDLNPNLRATPTSERLYSPTYGRDERSSRVPTAIPSTRSTYRPDETHTLRRGSEDAEKMTRTHEGLEPDVHTGKVPPYDVPEMSNAENQTITSKTPRQERARQQTPERDYNVTTRVPVIHSPVHKKPSDRRTESRSPTNSRRERPTRETSYPNSQPQQQKVNQNSPDSTPRNGQHQSPKSVPHQQANLESQSHPNAFGKDAPNSSPPKTPSSFRQNSPNPRSVANSVPQTLQNTAPPKVPKSRSKNFPSSGPQNVPGSSQLPNSFIPNAPTSDSPNAANSGPQNFQKSVVRNSMDGGYCSDRAELESKASSVQHEPMQQQTNYANADQRQSLEEPLFGEYPIEQSVRFSSYSKVSSQGTIPVDHTQTTTASQQSIFWRQNMASPPKVAAPKSSTTKVCVPGCHPLQKAAPQEHVYSNRDYAVRDELWTEVPEAQARPKVETQSLMKETYHPAVTAFRYASQSPSARSSGSSKEVFNSGHGLVPSRSASVVRSRPDSMLAQPCHQRYESIHVVDYQKIAANSEPNFGDANVIQWGSAHSSSSSKSYVVSRGTDTGNEHLVSKPSQTEVLEINMPDSARSSARDNDLRLDLGSMREKPDSPVAQIGSKKSNNGDLGNTAQTQGREPLRTAQIKEINQSPEPPADQQTHPTVRSNNTSTQRSQNYQEELHDFAAENTGILAQQQQQQQQQHFEEFGQFGYHASYKAGYGAYNQGQQWFQGAANDYTGFQNEFSEITPQDLNFQDYGQEQVGYQENNWHDFQAQVTGNQGMQGYGYGNFRYQEQNFQTTGGQKQQHGWFQASGQGHFEHPGGNIQTFESQRFQAANQKQFGYHHRNMHADQNFYTHDNNQAQFGFEEESLQPSDTIKEEQQDVQQGQFEANWDKNQHQKVGEHQELAQNDNLREAVNGQAQVEDDANGNPPNFVKTPDAHHDNKDDFNVDFQNLEEWKSSQNSQTVQNEKAHTFDNQKHTGLTKMHDSQMKVSRVRDSKYTIKRMEEWVIKVRVVKMYKILFLPRNRYI